MSTQRTLRILRSGHAEIQDLGRPGLAEVGLPANGAADQHAARTANVLVGNEVSAPLVEITGSDLELVADGDLLLSVTGAATEVLVDGHRQPAREALAVPGGSRVHVPYGRSGFRSYLAVNGRIEAEHALGSVSADPLLGVGTRLLPGDALRLTTRYCEPPSGHLGRLFRLGAGPARTGSGVVWVTEGPDLARLELGRRALAPAFVVQPQSNHVGLRLDGPAITQVRSAEILSRGVPVGAVEVPPTGGIIMLLRGRLVTAGYPVVAVVTSESLDRLAQLRPGDAVRMSFCDVATARGHLQVQADALHALRERVRSAFAAKGIAEILEPLAATGGTR